MPKKYKNVSPQGAMDIPVLGQVVEPGEIFTVPDELAGYFDGQDAVFLPVVPKAAGKSAAEKAAAKAAAAEAVVPSSSDKSGEPAIGDTKTEGN